MKCDSMLYSTFSISIHFFLLIKQQGAILKSNHISIVCINFHRFTKSLEKTEPQMPINHTTIGAQTKYLSIRLFVKIYVKMGVQPAYIFMSRILLNGY